jgi:hypothetical protein
MASTSPMHGNNIEESKEATIRNPVTISSTSESESENATSLTISSLQDFNRLADLIAEASQGGAILTLEEMNLVLKARSTLGRIFGDESPSSGSESQGSDEPQDYSRFHVRIRSYVSRMLGHKDGADKGPHIPPPTYLCWAAIGTFIGILTLNIFQDAEKVNFPLVASFGAQSVLLFGVPQAPFAQPHNAITGNTLAAFVGVLCRRTIFGTTPVLNAAKGALAVSLSVILMLVTGSVHPPAGATALFAVIAPDGTVDWMYPIFPIMTGSILQVCIAVFWNNISLLPSRQYPVYWLFWKNLFKGFGTPMWGVMLPGSSYVQKRGLTEAEDNPEWGFI